MQGLATFALLPLVLWQQGLSPSDLPLYLQQGAGLLFGITEAGRNAGGSLAVSARYIVCKCAPPLPPCHSYHDLF